MTKLQRAHVDEQKVGSIRLSFGLFPSIHHVGDRFSRINLEKVEGAVVERLRQRRHRLGAAPRCRPTRVELEDEAERTGSHPRRQRVGTGNLERSEEDSGG